MSGTPNPLFVSSGFFKGHGLGNDYLVMEEGEGWVLSSDSVRAVCDRWRGVGADGIVVLLAGEAGEVRLRMFNPDGSEFERSGNGLRILAAYLARSGRVGSDWFRAAVGGGEVGLRVHGFTAAGLFDVSVDMGAASFDSDAVHLDAQELDAAGRVNVPGHGPVEFTAVSLGNPHCVVFVDELSDAALDRLGPALASHSAFRRGTNVQLVRSSSPGMLEILIWERGVGPTTASGTSACAAAAASVRRGRQGPGNLRVRSPGGEMEVSVAEDWGVVLRAPVQEICQGELTPGFLRSLT